MNQFCQNTAEPSNSSHLATHLLQRLSNRVELMIFFRNIIKYSTRDRCILCLCALALPSATHIQLCRPVITSAASTPIIGVFPTAFKGIVSVPIMVGTLFHELGCATWLLSGLWLTIRATQQSDARSSAHFFPIVGLQRKRRTTNSSPTALTLMVHTLERRLINTGSVESCATGTFNETSTSGQLCQLQLHFH